MSPASLPAGHENGAFVMNKSKVILSGATILYFIIGFEILIMISPFAAFFTRPSTPFYSSWPNIV